MVLNACEDQPLPPSGMAYAVALHLTSTRATARRNRHRGALLSHLVTARDDVVNVYEVRRSVTENGAEQDTVYHLRSHQIFGQVTGLGRCRVSSRAQGAGSSSRRVDAEEDEWDTLVISFKDAKVALMQWSDSAADLVTVSIHTYERAPQVAEGVAANFHQVLRLDPISRCVALLLPQGSLAILPFYNDTAEELDELLERAGGAVTADAIDATLPYAPSFVLPLQSTDDTIRNVRDFVFLPDFQRPTIAVLYEKDQTWTGRLDERHDSCSVRVITLDLSTSSDASHGVIASRDGLPYNARYLTACPQSVGGGILITTDSALIHMDQGGKIVGAAVNGWHSLTSKVSLPRWKGVDKEGDRHVNGNGTNGMMTMNGESGSTAAKDLQLTLANSHIVFPDTTSPLAMLFLSNGNVWQITMRLEGRSIASLALESRGSSVQPSLVTKLPSCDLLLVGCLVGDAHLLRLRASTASTAGQNGNAAVKGEDDDMDLDADLYGDQAATTTNGHGSAMQAVTAYELHLSFVIKQLGSILHVTPAVTGDLGKAGGIAQTLVCCGAGTQGGLALIEPQIVPRQSRQLMLNATNGLWHIRSDEDEKQMVLLASNANSSEIATLSLDGESLNSVQLRGRTIYASALPTRDLSLVRVTERGIEIIKKDGKVTRTKQIGKDRAADVDVYKAEYVAGILSVLWTDGTLQMFELRRGQMVEITLPKEISERKFIAAGVTVDKYETLHLIANSGDQKNEGANSVLQSSNEEVEEVDYGDDIDDKDRAGTAESSEAGKTYIVLTSDDACVQIYTWPGLKRAWQSNSLYPAPSRLDYTFEAEEEEEVPSFEISQVQLCHVGDTLHLTVAYQNGLVNVFEANPFSGDHKETVKAYANTKSDVLALSFIKVLAKQLDVAGAGVMDAPNGDSLEGVTLIPFARLNGLDGLFIGGVAPAWLLRERNGVAYLHMSAERSMDQLSVIDPAGDGSGGRFIFVQYGIVNVARMPVLDFSLPVAHRRKASTHRSYTNATPHPVTKTIVAASVVEQQFVLFDPEDGHVVEDPSADPTSAQAPRSALELFVDEDGEPVDGYEFQQCEMVSSLELVTLRSVGSMSGLKDYIAVGTIIAHGEDRPARGATYVFDVVEIVAPADDPAARFKLRLLVRDDCKGPISNVTDMNGYLVIVMGLKLFIRSLEKDEWLITVAFLDIPYQISSVQRLKNFLLLTDVHKSVWFVAFQEEPYRLVVISKDYNDIYQSCGSFLVRDEEMTIVAAAKDGTVRLYDYAPTLPASQGGQRLLIRCEYACGNEASWRMALPGAASNDGGISTSNEVLLTMMNGSVHVLRPLEDEIFNVLHLLQGQLVRNAQHFAGLNPRAYRVVRNEIASRPLTRGILDGRLLSFFEMLSRPKMDELAKLIPDLVDGTDQLLRYIATLRSNWGAV